MDVDRLLARLRGAFLEDLDEQLARVGDDLLALEADPADAAAMKRLFRAAHTVKGAARAASLPAVEHLCHAMESRLAAARDRGEALLFPPLFAASDALAAVGRDLRAGRATDDASLDALALALERGTFVEASSLQTDAASFGAANASSSTAAASSFRAADASPSAAPEASPAHADSGASASNASGASGSSEASLASDESVSAASSGSSEPPVALESHVSAEAAEARAASGSPAPSPSSAAPAGRAAHASSSSASPSSDQPAVPASGRGTARRLVDGSRASSTHAASPRDARERRASHAATVEDAPGQGTSAERGRPGTESPARSAGVRRPAPEPIHAPSSSEGEARVRVDAEKLDTLLDAVERLLVSRGRLEARVPQVRDALVQARDPREGDRLGSALEADARALGQAADSLAAEVRRVRMRPLSDAAGALPRVARDVAAARGKQVRVVVRGGETEADRAVVDAVREALLHLARNAVDHGIEAPADRVAAGKPAAGTLELTATRRGERLLVTLRDDGRGVDAAALRQRLRERGADVPRDDAGVASVLLAGGVSSRQAADAVSGRGVGMDAARAAVERVRGHLALSWTEGRGTALTMDLPLTLATARVVLVQAGGHPWALPVDNLERLFRVDPAALRRMEGRTVVPGPEGPVPIVSLAALLGPPLADPAAEGGLLAARLCVGERRLAVVVDAVEDERELVVRALDAGPGAPPYAAGAALLGTGAVAVLLDAAALMDRAESVEGVLPQADRTAARARPRVLVVDDSLTTRTLEQGTLEAAGYEVETAVDGADGWRRLQEKGADLVVSDVEMPLMDGLELTRAIRASARFARLPVVLVTSLEKPEHRDAGLEAGADAYVPKSGFDVQELLATVRRLLGEGRP